MSFRFSIAVVLSIVCLATPAWADFEAGTNAYDRGDFTTALREWRLLAEQGDAEAQFNLGLLYSNGRGVPQDYALARQWYEKAAAQGVAEAQFNLGRLYAFGQGVPQDYALARQWWEKAAAQGVADAQFNLGLLYAKGRGVPQDYVQAHKWFNLSGVSGNKKAVDHRDALATKMPTAQIAEAQKLALEWRPEAEKSSRAQATQQKKELDPKESGEILVGLSAHGQSMINFFEANKNQWEFNVRYGAPPITQNHKNMIYVRIPKHQQQFSACHEKLFGSKITKEDIRQYMKNDEALALFLAIGETAKVINSSPVVPQDMSVLNAAPKHEVALNLLYFNGMFKVFDEGFNLYVDTDKNWCDNFKKSLSR